MSVGEQGAICSGRKPGPSPPAELYQRQDDHLGFQQVAAVIGGTRHPRTIYLRSSSCLHDVYLLNISTVYSVLRKINNAAGPVPRLQRLVDSGKFNLLAPHSLHLPAF